MPPQGGTPPPLLHHQGVEGGAGAGQGEEGGVGEEGEKVAKGHQGQVQQGGGGRAQHDLAINDDIVLHCLYFPHLHDAVPILLPTYTTESRPALHRIWRTLKMMKPQ